MKRIWLVLALTWFLPGQAWAINPSSVVILRPDRGNWNIYGGAWEAPFSSGQFYGLEANGPRKIPKDWELILKWLLKIEANQGVTSDDWRFGAIEPFLGLRAIFLISSLDTFEREEKKGEVRLDLLFGTKIPVPEWDDGAEKGKAQAQGVTIHPRLQIDLWNLPFRPEINLAYRNNAELKNQRLEGEGKILLFRKGILQAKGGIWGARDETEDSYRAQEYGVLLEPKFFGKSSSLTLFGKMGYAREELLWKNAVVDGTKYIVGACWSF